MGHSAERGNISPLHCGASLKGLSSGGGAEPLAGSGSMRLIEGGTLRAHHGVGARALSSTAAAALVTFMYLPEEILRA